MEPEGAAATGASRMPGAGEGGKNLLLPAFVERFLLQMGRFVHMLGRVFAWTPRPPYDWRELLGQMVKVGVSSTPVVLLTALFTGMVLALQTFTVLKRFSAESYVGTLVALSMVRELSPVLTSLIVAGRAGSAMGAELGSMRVTEQIDALEVMATDPIHYLVVPRVWAAVLTMPLLVVMADGVGIGGGYLVSVVLMGANPVSYLNTSFQYTVLNDLLSGLIKAAVFGLLMATISCQQGFYTTGGAEGVGRSTTAAVVLSSIAILAADFFLTKLLF
ncbi:MAG TPA: ABC transporter permease [Thermoanaerobaculia bacterium]|nr:ABC transporter permease [Thermoanaerobaculia bacterium]